VLSFYHGYYQQHQYFPLLIFDGQSGFPLGAWLRPGTAHAACGAVESLDAIVKKIRQTWPEVTIVVRGDSGLAVPEMYEYCEANGLFYAFGYATNEVLKRRTDQLLKTVELAVRVWGGRVAEVPGFRRLSGGQLVASAPHLGQGRGQPHGDQPAVRGHQSLR
jgi:hypothetical protein